MLTTSLSTWLISVHIINPDSYPLRWVAHTASPPTLHTKSRLFPFSGTLDNQFPPDHTSPFSSPTPGSFPSIFKPAQDLLKKSPFTPSDLPMKTSWKTGHSVFPCSALGLLQAGFCSFYAPKTQLTGCCSVASHMKWCSQAVGTILGGRGSCANRGVL